MFWLAKQTNKQKRMCVVMKRHYRLVKKTVHPNCPRLMWLAHFFVVLTIVFINFFFLSLNKWWDPFQRFFPYKKLRNSRKKKTTIRFAKFIVHSWDLKIFFFSFVHLSPSLHLSLLLLSLFKLNVAWAELTSFVNGYFPIRF